jgi:hypothetical protein
MVGGIVLAKQSEVSEPRWRSGSAASGCSLAAIDPEDEVLETLGQRLRDGSASLRLTCKLLKMQGTSLRGDMLVTDELCSYTPPFLCSRLTCQPIGGFGGAFAPRTRIRW